nr:MAG TPA: hypothetical protein [Caudoviricetes sp.]
MQHSTKVDGTRLFFCVDYFTASLRFSTII